MKRSYGWVLVASQTAVFCLLAAVALVVLLRIRRRRDIERIARLRATEPPARPAYWDAGADVAATGESGEPEPWRGEVDPGSGPG
ncbi:MAG: hypothetical protein EXR92_07740 [Gemmatimonadetes bacterium]|nr:hypothetical protein [Gemmatimonadota bacterium]